MTLEDKVSGQTVDFNIYNEKDVPFLSSNTEAGEVIRGNIIDGDADDDC